MKKSFVLFSLLLAGFSTFGQLSCDLRLDDVQFTSTGPHPQPVLTISNLGLEPVTTAQIRWGISTQSQSIWPFSSSSWGGLLESGEVTQLTMPAVSVPVGNWIYSFEIIALNNSNPIFGVCAGFDEDGFCDGEISSSVLDIPGSDNARIVSTEYFNLLGMKVQHQDLEANRIYVKKSNFSDGQFSIQKIMIR
jgi:hypothetical protein